MGLYPTGSAALVADLSPPARRGEAMGLWGAAANLALALGPLAAVEISERLGFGWLFAISAVVGLAALAIALAQRETMEAPAAAPFTLRALLSPAVAFPCTVVFCLMATYGIQAAFLPLYARAQDTNPGLFFLVLALVVALVRGYAGQISDRVGRAPVACLGMGLTAAAMIALALGGGPWTLAGAGFLYGLGFGSAQPALMAWTADLVSADDRGRAMGTFYTALELGIAMGAIGGGALLSWTGYGGMFLLGAALTAAGGAFAALRLRTGHGRHAGR
jgi:MFS family permease